MEIRDSTTEEFQIHRDWFLDSQAQNLVQAQGLEAGRARLAAEQEWDQHLPQGKDTGGHRFYTVLQSDNRAGFLWLGIKANQLFVYDLLILPDYRQQGLGTQVMQWLREFAVGQGCSAVWLHVFGHNERALRLYEKLGYRAINISMRLDI